MNNTKRNLTAIAAILMTATLVVGTLAITTTTTKIAFAANNNSGNTVTAQINRQHGSGSGFDNDPEQEAQNTICTHPGENSACVQEGAAATTTTTPVTPATGTLLVKKVVVCEGDTVKAIVIRICPKPEDFTITVTGNNPTPSTFQGSTSGTLVTLGVGPYKVTEVEHESFEATFSTDCNGTIAPGDQKTCTITNTEEK